MGNSAATADEHSVAQTVDCCLWSLLPAVIKPVIKACKLNMHGDNVFA